MRESRGRNEEKWGRNERGEEGMREKRKEEGRGRRNERKKDLMRERRRNETEQEGMRKRVKE
jgi:hypothetical protein